jgi:hypothetical protein
VKGICIFDWFEMRNDVGLAQALAELLFKILRHMMGVMHCPVAGHEHVYGNETMGRGLAGSQGVEFHPFCAEGSHYPLYHLLLLLRQGHIHQPIH